MRGGEGRTHLPATEPVGDMGDFEDATAPFKAFNVVRAAGVEPARASRPYGFSYHFGFRRHRVSDVCGLDYPFTLASPL